jgi:hypothetical protein
MGAMKVAGSSVYVNNHEAVSLLFFLFLSANQKDIIRYGNRKQI